MNAAEFEAEVRRFMDDVHEHISSEKIAAARLAFPTAPPRSIGRLFAFWEDPWLNWYPDCRRNSWCVLPDRHDGGCISMEDSA